MVRVVTKSSTTAGETRPAANCEVCDQPFPARAAGPGRTQRYCSQRCRQEAYRRRHAPGVAELRTLVDELLGQVVPLDVAAVRATLPDLAVDELAALRRHLDAVTGPLAAIAARCPAGTRLDPQPAGPAGSRLVGVEPAAPETVTSAPVTPSVAALSPATAAPAPAGPVSAAARRPVGGLTPTGEQAAIIDACTGGRNLVIEAGAGTGKTSTLKMAAASMRGRGLYIAFNKAIATEAKRTFPRHVSCSTAHSLAFRAVGHAYKARLDGPRLPARETAKLLGIDGGIRVGADRTIEPAQLARLAMDAVGRYCRTADDELGAQHVPEVNGVDGHAAAVLADTVLPLAVAAWADIRDPGGKVRFVHDHYLKMWALTRPRLGADFVLFDEAQDADPLIASIVQAQPCQLIAVGDTNQAIYAWRGAVDAIATWPADQRLYLSQSWRFGPAVAAEANKWLQLLGARLRLTGTAGIASTVGLVDRPHAVLCRTNAEALSQAMAAMEAGRRAGLVGGSTAIRKLAQAAQDLQAGRGTDHPELFVFTSWAEVQEYVKHDDAGADLGTFVRMVDDFGADEIIAAANRLADERYADVVISTAHKAKGREWDSVLIGNDFRQPKVDETGRPGAVPRGEAMLAYVAVTRAKQRLDRGSLTWIDDQLAGRAGNGGRRGGRWGTDTDDWRHASRDDW